MAKYRKKPVEVEAFKWTGGPDQTEDPEWIIDALKTKVAMKHKNQKGDVIMLITTLEGVMRADLGDWIIRGVKGEIYPCKPDIFEKTYEKVEDAAV